MEKVGIDISKDKFDVALNGLSNRFDNDEPGFRTFLSWTHSIESDPHFVMEASGPYYLKLATFLHQQGSKVSVVNPLVIRRFAQMQLYRTKTDKVDAKVISSYAQMCDPAPWQPAPLQIQELQQLMTARDQLVGQATSTRNTLSSLKQSPLVVKEAVNSLSQVLLIQKDQIAGIEKRMEELARSAYPKEYQLLMSIPGIGPRMCVTLLLITHGFTRFEKAKQLVSYAGLSPRIFESGKTVVKHPSISKMGSGKLRQLAYLCSLSASRSNPSCKNMYARLLKRGKPKKVALIAVGAKLLRQAFGVVKSGVPFNPDFINMEKEEKS